MLIVESDKFYLSSTDLILGGRAGIVSLAIGGGDGYRFSKEIWNVTISK